MGLRPISEIEMQEIDGGGIGKWVAAVVEAPLIISALAVTSVADAAHDLGKGVVNDWNSLK